MRKGLLNNRIYALLLCLLLILAGIVCLLGVPKAYARVENEVRETLYYPGTQESATWSFTGTNNVYTPLTSYIAPERVKRETLSLLGVDSTTKVVMFSFAFPENAAKAVISTESGNFDVNTCFALNGASGYWLNQAGDIDVYKNDSTALEKLMLIKLPASYIAKEDMLYVDFYNGEEYVGSDMLSISLTETNAWSVSSQEKEPILRPTVNEDGTIDYSSLTWEITGGISGAFYEASLYRLVDGVYVALTDDIMSVTITENATATSDTVTVATGVGVKASAGAYQLCIKQMYDNNAGVKIELDSMNVPFFVSYR